MATLLVGHGVSCLLADLALPIACLLLRTPGSLVIAFDRLPAIARVTAQMHLPFIHMTTDIHMTTEALPLGR